VIKGYKNVYKVLPKLLSKNVKVIIIIIKHKILIITFKISFSKLMIALENKVKEYFIFI